MRIPLGGGLRMINLVGLKRSALTFALLLATILAATPAQAEIRFVVQPIIDRDATRKAFQPLADYLSEATGEKVVLKTSYDYADFWSMMKSGKHYDLIFDGAFYVDYRIKHQNHVPLAKVPGLVSYSLVAMSSSGIFEPSELIGKKIASLTPPAPGGLVMFKMFPNPLRQPYILPVRSSDDAMKLLLAGKVHAAMVPTPLAAQAMEQGKEISTVATTEQTPHMTITASKTISEATRKKIADALINATKSPKGVEMLKQIGFEGFEATEAKLYDGYSRYLDQEWDN